MITGDTEQAVIDAMYVVIKEGETCRDKGTPCPYGGNTVEHFLHSQGWLKRDLQLALIKSDPRYAASQAAR